MMAFSEMQELTMLINRRTDMVVSARRAALQISGGGYVALGANDPG
jgi:hypothetical protein